jgi:hypothetical protein
VLRFRPAIWTGALECYVAELYVVPERRRQGLRRALMEAAIEVARAGGATHMDLGTGEDDVAARALYESLGFDNRGGRPDGPVTYFYESCEPWPGGAARVARCSAAPGPIRPLAADPFRARDSWPQRGTVASGEERHAGSGAAGSLNHMSVWRAAASRRIGARMSASICSGERTAMERE